MKRTRQLWVPMISALLLLAVSACEDTPVTDIVTDDGGSFKRPAGELTKAISFTGGTVKSGSPPRATNNPGDPQLSGAPSTPSTMSPGTQGSMSIGFANVPPNTPFEVNVRFDDAGSYINIPIDTSITQGSTSGTLNLPFSLPSSVCDDLDNIRHQIACYESVSVGGTRVSTEQARQIVLNCESGGGSGFSGPGSYCAYNYPKDSCDIVIQAATRAGVPARFVPGMGRGACGPFSDVERTFDLGGLTSGLCSQLGCGACVIGGR
jgi:hypothetical protein